LQIGVFSNRWMQYALLSSLAILLAIIYVPFLDPIFNTAFLGWREWSVMLPLLFAPALAAEVTKFFGRRLPNVHRLSSDCSPGVR
jgi:Ca2+-transporting ATPase